MHYANRLVAVLITVYSFAMTKPQFDLSGVAGRFSDIISLTEKVISEGRKRPSVIKDIDFGCNEECKEKERLRKLLVVTGKVDQKGISSEEYYKEYKLFRKKNYV